MPKLNDDLILAGINQFGHKSSPLCKDRNCKNVASGLHFTLLYTYTLSSIIFLHYMKRPPWDSQRENVESGRIIGKLLSVYACR